MPLVTEKISGRMRHLLNLSLGCSSWVPCLPLSLGNGDGPGICSWPPTELSSTPCPPLVCVFFSLSLLAVWASVSPTYSCQDKQLRMLKVTGLSAQLFWPRRMPHSWLPGSRRGEVINFYAYHCQDHLLIRGGRLEMSPCKLSQSLHLGAPMAVLHSAWHSNKRRVQKGSDSPGWWTGGIGPINCSL